jgi:hypothetical protein
MRIILMFLTIVFSQNGLTIVSGSILEANHPFKFLLGLSINGQPCSGSYIGDNKILTAYHCFFIDESPLKKVDFKVVIPISKDNLSIKTEDYQFIESRYSEFHNLRGFRGKNSIPTNDIVVLAVDKKKIDLDEYFDPIKVGKKGVSAESNLLILGQGCNDYMYRSNDGHFRMGEFILTHTDEHFYRSAWSIHDYPMSAGACNGDSGGPMIIQESDGSYIQVGVASFATIYQFEEYGLVESAESHYVKLYPSSLSY